jgi:hypothetical protein
MKISTASFMLVLSGATLVPTDVYAGVMARTGAASTVAEPVILTTTIQQSSELLPDSNSVPRNQSSSSERSE